MAQNVIDILQTEDTEAVEKYGELSGTDKQMEIVRAARDTPEASPEELAERLDMSRGHVRNVLRRATSDFLDEFEESEDGEVVGAASDEPRQDNGAEADAEEDEVETPTPGEFDESEARVTAEWHGDGFGELAEVSALEWCDDCQTRHRVLYLVPTEAIQYLRGPECGSPGRYAEGGGSDEAAREVIEALRARVTP